MSELLSTVDQELAALGVVSSYIWKPSRMFVRSGSSYIPVDIVSDGAAEDVSRAVFEEGQAQQDQIDALAASQKTAISAYERDYATVRASLRQNYQRMYNYFMSQGLIALATIMATAIVNLSLM